MKQEDNVTLDGFNIQFGSFGLVEEDEDALQQEQDHHAVSKLEDSKPPSPPWRGLFTQPNSSRTAIDEEQRKDAECPSSLRPSLASHQIPLPNNNSVLSGEGRPASDVIHCQANEEKNDSLDELIRDALIKLHIHPSYETTAQLVRDVFFSSWFGLDYINAELGVSVVVAQLLLLLRDVLTCFSEHIDNVKKTIVENH